nr:hypothetical protein [Tanacetum cinerariifolium]
MVEPEKSLEKKDQIMIDEEVARNLEAQLQAELEEEDRLARQEEEDANIALIKLDEKVEAEVDNDQDEAEIKMYLKIVLNDEVAIDTIPLASKPPIIVACKIIKEGRISSYRIIRADGCSKRYSSMTQMLLNINREDLETLWKLVKAKDGNTRWRRTTRPEEAYERVLWVDLKVMFEPDIESEVRRELQGNKVTVWKLFYSCGVHFVRFQNLCIFMLVEKRYPLTPATIIDMLNRRGEQMDRSTGPNWKTGPDRTDRTGPNVFRFGPRSEILYQFGLRSATLLVGSPITLPPLTESLSDFEPTAPVTDDGTTWVSPLVRRMRACETEIATACSRVDRARRERDAFDLDMGFIKRDATRTSDNILALQEGRASDQERRGKLERCLDSFEVSHVSMEMDQERLEREFYSMQVWIGEKIGRGAMEARPSDSINVLAVYGTTQPPDPRRPPYGPQ